MKKKILLMPLMVVSLFTSCSNGGNDSGEVSLATRVKYCTVKGQKEKYNKGERVNLTFTPYPYFTLPNKEDLFIGGVNDFDYSVETGELSFNITTRTAIMVECTNTFGGREASIVEANNWFNIRTGDPLIINNISYDYAFYEIGEETIQGETILGIINDIIKGGEEFTTLEGKKTISGEDANKYSINYSNELFSTIDTTYIMKANDLLHPNNDDEMLISSTNIQPVKLIKQGVSGIVHYFSKSGNINELEFTFKDVMLDDPGIFDPINGYIKINATYN